MTDTLTRDWGPLAHPIRADHPGDDKPPWKDNSYLAFWDPENQVNGVVHVSTSPNAEGRRARASVQIGKLTAEVVEELPAFSFESDSIALDLDGEVKVDSDEIQVEVTMDPRGVPADYNAGNLIPALVAGEPVQHFQQAAIVTGTVTVHGESSKVNGIGLRDRTWGFRDESAMWPEYIGVIVDIDGELLTVMKFAGPDESTKTDGFLLGEQARPVSGLTDIVRDASGLFMGATIEVEGEPDLKLRVTERTGGFWVPMGWERIGPTMSAYDEFLTLSVEDGRVGHGLVEQGIVRRLQ